MYQTICLCDLAPGQRGTVRRLTTAGRMRRRLLDLGFIEDTEVVCLSRSPGGDPSAYLIRGTVIAIRAADGRTIQVEPVREGERECV